MVVKTYKQNNCQGRNIHSFLIFLLENKLIANKKELPRIKLFCISIDRGRV